MKLNKLIKNIQETLSLNTEELDNSSKEKSIQMILEKLNKRKKKIKKEMKGEISLQEKEELIEQLLIIKFQIKKLEKLLKSNS